MFHFHSNYTLPLLGARNTTSKGENYEPRLFQARHLWDGRFLLRPGVDGRLATGDNRCCLHSDFSWRDRMLRATEG